MVNDDYQFEVGDKVIITKSKQNWNFGGKMDKFIDKVVTITKIEYNDRIFFDGDEQWTWNYSEGHFKPYYDIKKPTKKDIKCLTNILKKYEIK